MGKLINFRTTTKVESALAYLRREKKGGFSVSETCRATIIRAAKKLGWRP